MSHDVRVASIAMDRLVNLGNYEHVKYSITVELNPGADPVATFIGLETILGVLAKKGPDQYQTSQAQRTLNAPPEQLKMYSEDEIERAKAVMQRWHELKNAQDKARELLRQLGGTIAFTDAKDQWEDPA